MAVSRAEESSFNSLFEMPEVEEGESGVADLDLTFNSLFEMQIATVQVLLTELQETFNSLFEMQ